MKLIAAILALMTSLSVHAADTRYISDLEKVCAIGALSQRSCSQLNLPIVGIASYALRYYRVDLITGPLRVSYRPITLGPVAPEGILTLTGSGLSCSGRVYIAGGQTADYPNANLWDKDDRCHYLSHGRR